MKIYNCNIKYKKNNFSLEVPFLKLKENKINCLIGDNGSGKSTLLKQIINDNCQHDIPSKILMLQKPYIFTGSVAQNINIIKKLNKNSKIDCNKLLADLDLIKHLDQQARSLSGGQRQRLAFALTMLSDFDLVLLDEPFNNTDIYSQNMMINVMKMYKKTYVLVSHKITLSKKIGDYFYLIECGKIIDHGLKEYFFAKDKEKINKLIEME